MQEFRERTRDDDSGGGGALPGGPGGPNLDAMRSLGEAYYAAGAQATENALAKGNSQAFISAVKQTGGQ